MGTSFTGVGTGIARELALLGAIAAFSSPSVANAQQTARLTMDLPEQRLGDSLRALAALSGQVVLADGGSVATKRAPALRGTYSLKQALDRLLAGSGLVAYAVQGGYAVGRADAGSDDPNAAGEAITVTGSRIRGAPVASPVIALDVQAMRDEGKIDLGDVVRAIPQSFGGGQNPGVGTNVPAASGSDVGGASTINLRGLGSDATLTLINGHRVAYNGSRQGVDVSALPLGIVQRIEVVADGASTLYGSDAVAGVANIILRRDYDGLEGRANLGASSEGGDFRQQYGVTAGRTWASGGLVASYEFARNTQILSQDRHFTASRPGITLLPPQRRHAVAFAGHQDLGPDITFSLDGLFNKRWSFTYQPANAAGDLSVSRTERPTTSRSIAIAPSLEWKLASGWRLALSGVYGDEDVWLHSNSYVGEEQTGSIFVCYCNAGRSVELAGDGPLFDLPGGAAKIASGVGYRYNLLNVFRGTDDVNNVRHAQDSYYAYAELGLPVVGAGQNIAGLRRLDLSAALRFERYPGIENVVTPKLGVIYSPLGDLTLKANWGRSFRAPTLLQQYQVQSAVLYNATSFGGTEGTGLLLTGGNPDLKPERARTWTATLEYRPDTVPGLKLQIGYFSTRYSDRIVTPIAYYAQALTNPLYAPYVDLAPDGAAVQQAIDSSVMFYNVSGSSYDPGQVVAIVHGNSVNAGRQTIHGIDMLADYALGLGERWGNLALGLNASYLDSRQELTPGAPVTDLAGTLFNPPHWRGRASVTWHLDGLSWNATLSRIGGVDDVRSSAPVSVDGVTTLDITTRYAFARADGVLHGLELSLTVQNLFNDQPATIATSSFYDTAYDSTNYSPVGRFIGIGIAKAW